MNDEELIIEAKEKKKLCLTNSLPFLEEKGKICLRTFFSRDHLDTWPLVIGYFAVPPTLVSSM